MIKLSSKRLSRSLSKLRGGGGGGSNNSGNTTVGTSVEGCNVEIKWEMRPGGMLVQKREFNVYDDDNNNNNIGGGGGEGFIVIKVTTISKCHDISIQSTSTFGELKKILSMVTSLEPREQRLLFKGKERDDHEHLHMVGVRDKDKVLLLEDPAIKEMKKLRLSLATAAAAMGGGAPAFPFRSTISV